MPDPAPTWEEDEEIDMIAAKDMGLCRLVSVSCLRELELALVFSRLSLAFTEHDVRVKIGNRADRSRRVRPQVTSIPESAPIDSGGDCHEYWHSSGQTGAIRIWQSNAYWGRNSNNRRLLPM